MLQTKPLELAETIAFASLFEHQVHSSMSLALVAAARQQQHRARVRWHAKQKNEASFEKSHHVRGFVESERNISQESFLHYGVFSLMQTIRAALKKQ